MQEGHSNYFAIESFPPQSAPRSQRLTEKLEWVSFSEFLSAISAHSAVKIHFPRKMPPRLSTGQPTISAAPAPVIYESTPLVGTKTLTDKNLLNFTDYN